MPLRSAWRGLAALALLLAACSDDSTSTTTSTTTSATTPSTVGPDATLDALLLTADDLPDGFAVSELEDDTVTTFCVGQDATAGLQASGRSIVTFRRTPEGVGIVQVVFRFEGADASAFVAKATQLFAACDEIPDAQGLAFSYGPASAEVEGALAPTTSHVARNGTSIGSGKLLSTTAVFQVGEDVAELVGVLGIDEPRGSLDDLAATAVAAAVAKATR